MTYMPDTHALVWYLTGDKRIGANAKTALARVDAGEAEAIISVMVLAEILYLNEKGRVKISLPDLLELYAENENYHVLPFTLEEIIIAQNIRNVPELFDRMIAATAKRYNAILLSRDHVLAKLQDIETLW